MSIEEAVANLKSGKSLNISNHSKVCGVINPRVASDIEKFIFDHEHFEILVDRPERIEHFTDDLPDAAWDLLDLNQEHLQLSFVVKRGLPKELLDLKSIPFRVIKSGDAQNFLRRLNGVLLLGKPRANPKPNLALDLLYPGTCEHIRFDASGRISI